MNNERAGYLLCYCNVKFNRFEIQAPMKHAGYSKHEKVSNVRIPLPLSILMLNSIEL